MGGKIHSYRDGEFLEVVQLESESSQRGKPRRKILSSLFANHRLNKWMVAGIVAVAIAILFKAFWYGLIYREEWILGGIAALCWLIGIKFTFGPTPFSRGLGRTISGVALLLWVGLLTAVLHPSIANGLAMHWLLRSGFGVNSGMAILGEDYVAAFSQPVSSLSIGGIEGELPVRVLIDLDVKQLSIDLSPSNTSRCDSRTIRNIAKVLPSKAGVINLDAGSLNSISDDDLRTMTRTGMVIPYLRIASRTGLKQSLIDYLTAPNITPFLGINCEGLTADDFQILETIANAKGPFRFMALTDCQIDNRSAKSIAKAATSVYLNSNQMSIGESSWRLNDSELDALITNNVPVQNLNVDAVSKQQCAGLSGNRSLSLINVKNLDGESVDLLAMSSLRTIGLDLLSEDAAQAMIRNRVGWRLSVDQTTAEYDTLVRLIQLPTLTSFYLQSKSQFTTTQRENLEK